MPAIDIGEHCADPYPCDFQGYCWDHVPEYSVLDLSGRTAVRWDLYRQGYQSVEDVPLELLTEKHKMEVEAFIKQKEIFNRKGIKDFLDTLWYPLYFLDFETINPADPPIRRDPALPKNTFPIFPPLPQEPQGQTQA